MQMNEEMLKVISRDAINSLKSLDIVTPSMYTAMFSKFATSHNLSLDNDEFVSNQLLDEKISRIIDIQDITSNNVIKLSENTDKAICAIKDKNEHLLMEVLNETNSLREEVERLKESMYKDELTQVYNRKWLHDKLLIENSTKLKESGTLAMIDLNYFKEINDIHGHVVGDKVLTYIANELHKIEERVVRYGGDEFLLIFSPDVSQDEANSVLNNIREKILSKKIKAGDSSFRISFSFGVSKFDGLEPLTTVIEQADKNMYDNKVEIKNRVPSI